MNAFDQIRQQSYDIDCRVADLEILLEEMAAKLADLDDLSELAARQAAALNCFLTCALRNVVLLKEHNEHILGVVREPQQDSLGDPGGRAA